MAHRMGIYQLVPNRTLNKRPVYEHSSTVWGSAFIYYKRATAGSNEFYWVVGPKIGSVDANLYAISTAQSPDKVCALPTPAHVF
jgi:hypothetical protein